MTDAHVLEQGHAPTPFTADEIRRGCPEGRRVTTRTESADGVSTRVTTFSSCDDTGATLEGPDGEYRFSWLDLQGHASFPAAATTISDEVVETDLGRLDCRRYEVLRGDEVHIFWFAKDLPGMPVLATVEAHGSVISRSTVIANQMPDDGTSGS